MGLFDVFHSKRKPNLNTEQNENVDNITIMESVVSDDGTFTDERDGKVYKVVKIGNQVWMAENLAYEIPGKKCRDDKQWERSGDYDKWSYYENKKPKYSEYGILYQWEAAKIACPPGWHLPSDDEWKELEKCLGMSQSEADKTQWRGDIAKKITSKRLWEENCESGTSGNELKKYNTSGFSALPGGYRNDYGLFEDVRRRAQWWTSFSVVSDYSWCRLLSFDRAEIGSRSSFCGLGFSVRCVQDDN